MTWTNYFTDLPQTAIIPSIIKNHPGKPVAHRPVLRRLRVRGPASVSFVDPEFGVLSDIGAPLVGVVGVDKVGVEFSELGGDEEPPQDLTYGENWAYQVVDAVLRSPAWPRTLLIYTFDEHGGYYDHVAPPAAVAPDGIPPDLAVGDRPGGYNLYGPRVPAIVASPYSKASGITDVVHDHTSVLATIEAKWNLPALTYRDANASTVLDFLDLGAPHSSIRPLSPDRSTSCPELLGDLEGGR